jgi:ABC-type nitrate/sulfonate/bicarbonate transport system substrate-binding protein
MNGLKIGGVPEHFNYPWRLGIERGDFSEKGLRLHWSDMTGGTGQMIRGLETGSIDVAVLLTEGIVQAICNGLPAKIISGYVESPLTWGIHTSTSKKNKILSDFSGGKFAISRMGSGSHLMAYVLAEEEGWKHPDIDFNVVGDVYGGLWAIENGEADFFLWEKFTTQPFVDQGKCARIATIETPWPCFVIAAREDVLATRNDELQTMCGVIKKLVVEVMENENAYHDIAWRYHLQEQQTKEWFSETRWDSQSVLQVEVLESVTSRLLHLGLLSGENPYSIERMIKQMNA